MTNVWVGHSCPTPLTLILPLTLTSPVIVIARLPVKVTVSHQNQLKVKNVGQECRTHTKRRVPV